jgi:hypothetical protein
MEKAAYSSGRDRTQRSTWLFEGTPVPTPDHEVALRRLKSHSNGRQSRFPVYTSVRSSLGYFVFATAPARTVINAFRDREVENEDLY